MARKDYGKSGKPKVRNQSVSGSQGRVRLSQPS